MKPKRNEKFDATLTNIAHVEKSLEQLATDLAAATRESIEIGDELRHARASHHLGDVEDGKLEVLIKRNEAISATQRETKQLHDDVLARLETLRSEREQIEADRVLATIWQHNDARNTLLERLDKAVDFMTSIVDDIARLEREAVADGVRLRVTHRRTFTQVIADRIKSSLQPYFDSEGWKTTLRMSATPNERLGIELGLRDQLLTNAQRAFKQSEAMRQDAPDPTAASGG